MCFSAGTSHSSLRPMPNFCGPRLGVEVELADQHLGERATRTFGEEGVFAEDGDAGRVVVLVAAVAGNAHVAGDNAFDLTIGAEDHVDDREARIDLDAEGFGLFGEPAGERAEAADIAAVIAHQRRHEDVRHADAAGLPQIIELILGDRGGERQALVAPIGNERVEAHRIDHRAREDMRADLRALLQHDDGELLVGLGRKLLQPDRRGQPSGSGADDDDVELHALALDRFSVDRLRLRGIVQGFAPNPAETKKRGHSRKSGNPVSINMV